ncbi:DNA mismatch repair protein MutS [Massilimicrobiota timonensis]|uniref:DNA mismatch repair protein MutS n=1 Tax=Massilimicrobiota timonensis TaxID=1776392 RepID=A0A1Y4SXF1_9FIRM|nr:MULTISPECIES: DNA mismatch repair protein MutS [Bacillota]OUQ34599.1 DNA mismatch repair protein MutS [Massilimicrobiota timonensis]QUN13342.1 DNA mismatch repair protein MutS [Clostridium sp. C1]
MKQKYSPMMMQYLEIKEQNQDAIVMFRLGDFYEMFFDDAIVVSKALDLALTGKNAGVKERVPMCGVPFHSVSGYIQKLIDLGHKVAIVEQLSEPGKKGIVKRGVVQIITPGTIMDTSLNEKRNHYIGALGIFDFNYTLAYCDISTGEFYVVNIDKKEHILKNYIDSLGLKEIVVSEDWSMDGLFISHFEDDHFNDQYKKIFESLSDLKQIKMCSLLLNYMLDTQKRELEHLQKIQEVKTEDYIYMDSYTKKSLELIKNLNNESYGTLQWLLDDTKSAMGGRLLRQWIERPLVNQEKIEKRMDIIEVFIDNFIERETIKDIINDIYDLEKLAGRIAFGNVNARDLKWIASSLNVVPELKHQLLSLNTSYTDELAHQLVDLSHLTKAIDDAIVDNPPLTVKEGGLIKSGYNQELDELRYIRENGKQWLSEFEAKERERTGIKGLKIGYNRVFGYYIEVTKSYLPMIKDEFEYTRKQSISNAERFVTPELKEMEAKILSANDKIVALEYEIFVQLREYMKKDVHLIQDVAGVIAQIDVYQSLASKASQNSYVRPVFNLEHRLHIVNGRHSVIEQVISRQNYVPNDIDMSQEQSILLITGPNMGGKSTYMRQIALSVIMAQIGSFVPADEAHMPIFDQIFTRIGASDDLISGQSTFMVEMLEANNALRYATKDSLIIFDEIGRGTATFDGMAIAQSIIEYIASSIQCITLFSTHYHELTMMDDSFHIQNVHASASIEDDHIVFLYKIKPGRSHRSYGINVAQLAKLPDEVIQRSQVILESLENNNIEKVISEKQEPQTIVKESVVEKALSRIDPMTLSPIEALSTLIELKKLL